MPHKFDPTTPRRMYWDTQIPKATHCPECSQPLVSDYQTYLIGVRGSNDDESDAFVTGNDKGYFCKQCPVVVLDYAYFKQNAYMGNQSVDSFLVAGIVDTDSITDEELEDDIVLTEFLPSHTRQAISNKIGRNEPCPCGSGKKFKKCCMAT